MGLAQALARLESDCLWHQQRSGRGGGLGGEVPGDWRQARRPASSPLPSPPFLSPDSDNQGERGCSRSRGSRSSQNPQGGFPGLRAVWQGPLVGRSGHTAAQHEATLSAQASPHPCQTWCLDAPTPAGTV